MVGQPAIIYINVEYTVFKKVISIVVEHDHLIDKSALAERTGVVIGSLLSQLLYVRTCNIQSKLKVQYSHISSYTITCVTIRPVNDSCQFLPGVYVCRSNNHASCNTTQCRVVAFPVSCKLHVPVSCK